MRTASTALALLVLAGCRAESPAEPPPIDTLAVARPAEGPADAAVVRTTTGACTLVAQDSVALYARPSTASARFGTLAPGDSVAAAGRAAGYIGITPGTAQAANVGPFRLRYADADGPFALVGACGALPRQPRLHPTACYEMALADVRLYVRPDTASSVVATLPAGAFARATRRTPTGWLRVTVDADGPPGWVAPADVNQNGPGCATL